MVSAARIWALFKSIRIFTFSLSTIVSIAWTALYIFFLIHGWASFMVKQRVIILFLVSIYGISSIVLYLMIVVLFRPWVDGAWVAFLVLFQAGGTVAFFLFRPSLPCNNIGSEATCKTMVDIVIFGGWSLSGLLLVYASSLVIMSYVPVPAPRPDPEAALAIKFDNETSLEKEKRKSVISVGSGHSRSSFIGPATPGPIDRNREAPIISSARTSPNYYRTGTPTSVRSIVPSIHYPIDSTRAPSIISPGRTDSNYYYRPGTPGSIRSTTTSGSSTQGLTNPKYNYIYPGRVPTPASSILSRNARPSNESIARQGTPLSVVSYQDPIVADGGLTSPRYNNIYPSRVPTPASSTLSINARPPNDSISRQGTPLSVVSYQDPTVTDGLHNQQHPRSLTPSSLTPGIRGQNTSRSLTYAPNVAAPPLVQPVSTTISLRRAPPGFRRTRLEGSVHMLSRSGSVSSVPRSPSPQNLSFDASILVTPMAAVLPAHPGLPMNSYHGRRGEHEVRRSGAAPDIRANDASTYANAHHRTVNGYPGVSVNNFVVRGNNEQHAKVQRWRQDMINNAAR